MEKTLWVGNSTRPMESVEDFDGCDLEPVKVSADVFTLCRGRHDTPCDDYIFDHIDFDVVNLFGWLENQASQKLGRNDLLIIYVTGCTPALIAALNCARGYKNVCLMHYNPTAKRYDPQWLYR